MSIRLTVPGTQPMRTAQARRCAVTQTSRAAPVISTFYGMKSTRDIPSQMVTIEESSLEGPQNGSTLFAMRHGVKKARLGRPADQRKALVRGLVTEVLRHGKITTTKPRAKAIRKQVDKMIGLAKDGSLHARRQALAFVYDKDLVQSLFEQVPDRYGERNGGYCRVKTEVQKRRGDNAEMATIELV